MEESHVDKDSEPDMELVEGSSSTKTIAVGVILASVYGVMALLPMSGFLAATGVTSFLSFAICIAPLFGLILGPTRGFVFGLIGGFLATMFSFAFGGGVYLFVPTAFLGPAFAGLFTGLALKKTSNIGGFRVPGPLLTFVFFAVIIILYEIPAYSGWWFMTPYMVAAFVALLLQVKTVEFNPALEGVMKFLQILPLTLIGAMADHSMLAMGSIYLLGLDGLFMGFVVFPAMVVERIAATLISAVVASIILTAFGNELWLRNQE
ncbi:MAG: hypothetical protein ACXAEN_21015 [Candidatus Thorarchaeota archaeon]|jgi:hypothetical protein